MTEKSQRAATQVLIAVSFAAVLSGCTTTPWGGTSYDNTSGSYQTNGAPTGAVAAGYYRVNPGDTLPGIAAAYGQRPQDLAQELHLRSPGPAKPGMLLLHHALEKSR